MPRITKRIVESLKPDPERELYVADDDLPGFGIRLRPSGAASYVIRYRTEAGESRRFTIGRVAVLSPDEARRMAQSQLAAVAAGADPVRERRKKRHDPNATTQGAEDMEQVERIRQFKIFSEVDPGDLSAVADIAQARELAAGEQIIAEGAPADQLYLVAKGRVAVKVREAGGGQVQIDELTPGEVLGWGAVVEPHVYTASAWATEPAELILIDGAALRELCDANKQLGYVVFKNIGEVMSARLGQAVRGQGIDEMHRFKIFRDLDFGELDAIGRISQVREVGKGDLLTTEGASAEELYLFLSGSAEVKVRDPEGRQVLIDQIGPGDVLGWSAAMQPHIYTASAWAAEPSQSHRGQRSDAARTVRLQPTPGLSGDQGHRRGHLPAVRPGGGRPRRPAGQGRARVRRSRTGGLGQRGAAADHGGRAHRHGHGQPGRHPAGSAPGRRRDGRPGGVPDGPR